jgi:DNA-binding NarL/FixJ family response regulator
MREGIRLLLTRTEGFCVVGEAGNGIEAIAQTEALRPDVVLMDLRMPLLDGAAATESINRQFPQVQVIMLTGDDEDEYIAQALRCGASGYLLKNTPTEELLQAISLVHKGYTQLGPGLGKRLLAQLNAGPMAPAAWDNLTVREQEVARLIGNGLTNDEIAKQLCISKSTVKNHITKILQRLNVRDRTQVAILTHSI